MPCYHPLKGYYSNEIGDTGKRQIVFRKDEAFCPAPIYVPCGKCIGCRLEKSRQWAMRCMHEASLYEDNCFLTLTYDDQHLPVGGSLNKRDIQLFLKRLRKVTQRKIRFYQCGEYGDLLQRPHHHVIIFNYDFLDKRIYSVRDGARYYVSPLLMELWPHGFSIVADVTFESAAYVARYAVKKITGSSAASHYGSRLPEYATMSRRGGIGKDWINKYKSDVFPGDFVVVRGGLKCRPPLFYDRILELTDKKLYDTVKIKRAVYGIENRESERRLETKERIKLSRIKLLKRGVETNGE